MHPLDTARAYLQVRANGYSHGEAARTAGAVKSLGGLANAKSMLFSAGGMNASGGGLYWPNTFRKLTDSWEERRGGAGGGVSLDQFWSNSTCQVCLAWIQRTFPEARPQVMDGEGDDAKEVPGHPLTQLLNRPNPFYTPHRLWQVTLADWWLTGKGNAYWRIIRSGAGEPVELWHLPAIEMRAEWPRDGSQFISHYLRTVNGETEKLKPRDVIHFRFGQDAHNSRLGWSPLLAGAREVANLNEGADYRLTLLDNHAVPSYSMTPTEPEVANSMTPETVDALKRIWKDEFTNRGRGNLFIPNFVAKLDRVGYSPEELDIRQMLEWDADVICALFGLSAMVVNLPSGDNQRTYANMAEARESAFESNIVPTQALFAADLELQLLPQFDRSARRHVGWDYSQVRVLQEDQNKLYARLAESYQKGLMTRNEARGRIGLPPVAEQPAPAPDALEAAAGAMNAN